MSKILIIEDNDILNNAYKIILQKNGSQVEVAFDGSTGLVKAEHFKPDIILLDLVMPNMNGIEFLQKYDRNNKHKNVKIIILTNLGHDKDIAKAIKLGANRYILKADASPKQLATAVNHIVKKS